MFGALSLLGGVVIVNCLPASRETPHVLPEISQLEPALIENGTHDEIVLPGETQTATVSFTAVKGESRVVNLDMEATFQADSGRKRSLYATVGIACGPIDGMGQGAASSGTENLLDSKTRDLQRTVVYTAPSDGPQRCNARFAANAWDPGYSAAEIHLVTRLATSLEPVSFAHEARPDQSEPVIIGSDTEHKVIDETFNLDATRGPSAVTVSISSHLTSCVIENGSKDDTEDNLCLGRLVDRDGSNISSTTKLELLDGVDVCREMIIDSQSIEIDHLVHHKLIGSRHFVESFLDEPCGQQLRISQSIRNEGPAAIIVHRGSSSVVVSGSGV